MRKIISASLILLFLLIAGAGIFFYKIKYGFASYETDIPEIDIPQDYPTILLFSKTTAFRHGESIEAAKTVIDSLARESGWYVYDTEEGGVFNLDQLALFDVVIWNNVTGPVLNQDQRQAFRSYIEEGGGFIGIHGAGDFSHRWDWYREELIAAEFSHHPIKNQIQTATIYLSESADSTWNTPPVWTHKDEWYVFHSSPEEKDAEILYWFDGTTIDPNGNLLWIRNKDFGMGDRHPVVWIKNVKKGTSFYTPMGHNSAAINNKNFVKLLEGAIQQLL